MSTLPPSILFALVLLVLPACTTTPLAPGGLDAAALAGQWHGRNYVHAYDITLAPEGKCHVAFYIMDMEDEVWDGTWDLQDDVLNMVLFTTSSRRTMRQESTLWRLSIDEISGDAFTASLMRPFIECYEFNRLGTIRDYRFEFKRTGVFKDGSLVPVPEAGEASPAAKQVTL